MEPRDLAAISHVLGIFTWFVGPLAVMIISEEEFAVENARNALNWQIMFTLYMTASSFMVLLLIGIVLIPILAVTNLIFCVIAAAKASNGETWDYPLTPEII